jgi:hypothetical protein
MDVSECPWCGLVNPPEAQRCDCGYDFTTGDFASPYITKASQVGPSSGGPGISPLLVPFGWVGVLFYSLFALFYGLFLLFDSLFRLAHIDRLRSISRLEAESSTENANRCDNSKNQTSDNTEAICRDRLPRSDANKQSPDRERQEQVKVRGTAGRETGIS